MFDKGLVVFVIMDVLPVVALFFKNSKMFDKLPTAVNGFISAILGVLFAFSGIALAYFLQGLR